GAWLRAQGRAEYAYVTDDQAVAAFQKLGRLEGILPALESAHAVAHAESLARELGPSAIILVNLSGRGDKDVHTMEKHVAHRRDLREFAARGADRGGYLYDGR